VVGSQRTDIASRWGPRIVRSASARWPLRSSTPVTDDAVRQRPCPDRTLAPTGEEVVARRARAAILPRVSARRPVLVAFGCPDRCDGARVSVGPADISLSTCSRDCWVHLPLIHYQLARLEDRLGCHLADPAPACGLGRLGRCHAAGGGAAYQGGFSQPAGRSVSLGSGGGGGLGATLVIVDGSATSLNHLLAVCRRLREAGRRRGVDLPGGSHRITPNVDRGRSCSPAWAVGGAVDRRADLSAAHHER